ncbi:hypothetical protein [Cardinium endosymbiont of Nabis limbatus]|uniref:hypothetical protein n=1 Tax=Cardinium endosymbiont of Nabis limbatus TaxID=3066217 RepID=UPI003AF36ACD
MLYAFNALNSQFVHLKIKYSLEDKDKNTVISDIVTYALHLNKKLDNKEQHKLDNSTKVGLFRAVIINPIVPNSNISDKAIQDLLDTVGTNGNDQFYEVANFIAQAMLNGFHK